MDLSNALLIDTNVWLDYVFGERPYHDEARQLVLEAVKREVPLAIAPHSLSDVFFLTQQLVKANSRDEAGRLSESAAASARQFAWAVADLIMELALVGPTDIGDARVAAKFRSVHPDLEDNLVVATALHAGARMLVTNDAALQKHCPMAAMASRDALALVRSE